MKKKIICLLSILLIMLTFVPMSIHANTHNNTIEVAYVWGSYGVPRNWKKTSTHETKYYSFNLANAKKTGKITVDIELPIVDEKNPKAKTKSIFNGYYLVVMNTDNGDWKELATVPATQRTYRYTTKYSTTLYQVHVAPIFK